ncbi:hypothetical protein F5Y16DRAFT_394228 [Xylariaceae sp. FL0255]|nr:hypothetical protein F5Y16DRAFT_394228 [Xylariaceae sp. FL0255]
MSYPDLCLITTEMLRWYFQDNRQSKEEQEAHSTKTQWPRPPTPPSLLQPPPGTTPTPSTIPNVSKALSLPSSTDSEEDTTPLPPSPIIIDHLLSKSVPLVIPRELAYECAVSVSNLLYRLTRPTYVVQPQKAAHVQETVRAAKKYKVSLTIKNGDIIMPEL